YELAASCASAQSAYEHLFETLGPGAPANTPRQPGVLSVAGAARLTAEGPGFGWEYVEATALSARDAVKLSERDPDRANAARLAEEVAQIALLREVFGNPFRPVSIDSAWLTPTVIALARGIYEERAFERLPILADALQELGCDNSHLLKHLRSPGLHV